MAAQQSRPGSAAHERKARTASWNEQLVSTVSHVRRAITSGDRIDAVEWIDYADWEWAGSNYGFYTQWHQEGEAFLLSKGVTEADLDGIRADLKLLVNTRFDDGVPYDRVAELGRYRMLKARLVRHLNAPADVALTTFDEWKECWRAIHDRDVDYASGIMNVALVRFGEAVLEDLLRAGITPRFDARYGRYDISQVEWAKAFDDLVHTSIETQRGHLVGPEREGTPELQSFEDRVVISFQPCGTGGRTVAGDAISGTPSRHLAPYYFHTIDGKHDFAWNKSGVCQYCSHCAMMTGKLPIERFGYPLRVVDPPLKGHPNGRCTWTLYRDPRNAPASYYEMLGERKPGPDEPLGSSGSAARAASSATAAAGAATAPGATSAPRNADAGRRDTQS